jgi:UDP-2-acetamido-3-amino-2,3-dideoxy-glucuronate N-acetyltransferase
MSAERVGSGLELGEGGAWVHPGAELGSEVTLAPGTVVHDGARLGAGTTVGASVVIHAGTEIGADCLIEDGVVLGKRPRLRPGSSAAGELGFLSVADGATICAGAVVYAGARIGSRAIIGDHAQVRERAQVGARTVVGRGSTVDFDARVGEQVSIQTGVYVTGGSVIEDFVFLGPGVTTTNDHAMGRHAPGEPLVGPTFRRACRVGGGVVVTPGVVIGEEAFVAAGAVVTHDVGDREVVMGVPGRVVRRVGDEDLRERWT